MMGIYFFSRILCSTYIHSVYPEKMTTNSTSKMKKELGLFDVWALAAGATLSGGFFLLPGIAAASAGHSVPLAYLIAALFLLPGLLAKAELATAMPRSGGVYFFLDRSMGPLWGTMTGFGTWISLVLKTAFALVGVGAYIGIFFPDLPIEPVAAGLALVFGVLNMFGAKKTGTAQALVVIGLMLLIAWFTGFGLFKVELGSLSDMLATESGSLFSTAGLLIVSYMGLTKVASVAGEVKNPDRNLPLGMLLAFLTAIVCYVVGTEVMIAAVGVEVLGANGGDLTPVATVADALFGNAGKIVMTIASVLAGFALINAGIMSASRYPMAMSRDNLLPEPLGRVSPKTSSPIISVIFTVAVMLLFLTVFNPVKLAKLASAFQLLMFAMSTMAVIVMREARLASYDPGFKSPFYPWLQIIGIVASFWLIFQMGYLSIGFTLGLLWFGALWYKYYASDRVQRSGAIFNIFERLGRSSTDGLDRELRGILKEKGLRTDDPFDEIVARSFVIDIAYSTSFEDVVERAAALLAGRIPMTAHNISRKFLEGTRLGATPVTKGVALPHMSIEGLSNAELVIVRAKEGITLQAPDLELSPEKPDSTVEAIFFLISPKENPGQHLRILAQIARLVDGDTFNEEWQSAADELQLKEVLLMQENFLFITLRCDSKAAVLIGKSLKEIDLPPGNLIPVVRRGHKNIIPQGETVLEEGDRLTILGEPESLKDIRSQYFAG